MKNYKYDKISTYFKLNKKSFIIATITGIMFNGLMAFVPIIQGKLIDLYKEKQDVKYIVYSAVSFLAFVIFIQGNRYLKRYYVRDFSNRMVLQMRTVSFNNLIQSNIEDFLETSKGDIMSKNLSDIKDSAEGVRKILTEIYDSLILMIGYFVSMLLMDIKTTLIISSFLVLSVIVANLMKKIIYKSTFEYKKVFSKSKDVTLNALKNEVYYRGYGVSQNYYNEYSKVQDELERKSIKSMIYKGSMEPVYQTISLIGLFFVIYMCSEKVMNGVWLIGTFTAYLTTFMLVSKKTSKVGKIFNAYTTLKVSWKRCSIYLKNPLKQENIETNNSDPTLKVNNLTFGFDDNFKVNHISFLLNKGECLGICGKIHSGKSTLGAALSGIYNYEGSVKLYDVELKEVRNSLSPNFIAYIPSDIELFNDTLRYNVCFSNDLDVSKELREAYLDEEVNNFGNKDKELISHSCANLSGGQQKRLQIARALYNNSKLIIMDDPFNAIDIKMGENITNNIINNYKNSMIIIINNQKEIIKKMDKVLFLKDNCYLFGSYAELLCDEEFSKLMGGN